MLSALIVFVGIGSVVGIQPAVYLRYCNDREFVELLSALRGVMADRLGDCSYGAARFLQLAANLRAGNLGVGLETIDLSKPLDAQRGDSVIYVVTMDRRGTWDVRVYSPYAGRDCPDCQHRGAARCQGCLGCPQCRSLYGDPTCEACALNQLEQLEQLAAPAAGS